MGARHAGWSGLTVVCCALLGCGNALAVTPPPGAWIHQESDLQAGVLVDWSLWQGETYEAREGVRALDLLLETGRVRSVYLYVLSDGHTICPFAGVPLPSIGVAEDTAALARYVQQLHASNVKVYAVLDLLEWHRPGSVLPNPLDGELAEVRELPLDATAPVAGDFAAIAHPRTREVLTTLLTALRGPALPFDGIILDAHYTADQLLGGSAATLAAYQAEMGKDPAALHAPPQTPEDEALVEEFRHWRSRYISQRVDGLLRSIGEGVPETGLFGRADYWGFGPTERENLANHWPFWMGQFPHSVLLLDADYTDERNVRAFYGTREGVLKNGCAAVPRPVLDGDQPLADIVTLWVNEAGPVDEIVVRLKPGLNAQHLRDWAAALPRTCALPTVLPAFGWGQFAGAPAVDVTVADATPMTAVEQVAEALTGAGLPPLTVGSECEPELTASQVTLATDMAGVAPTVVLTWLAHKLQAYYDISAEAIVLHVLPDPERVMADRLQQLGRFTEAEAQYREVIARGVDVARAHRGLGDTLRKTWRPADALNEYDQAYQLGIRDVEFLMEAGNCFRDAGNVDYAQEFLMQALEGCPPENIFVLSWVNVGIGRIYDRRNEPAEAVIWFEDAVETWPGNAWAYYWLGKAQAALGQTAEAKASLERGLELDGGMTAARQLLEQLENLERRGQGT